MPTPFQLLHGSDTPPSPGVLLRAGPITALFEPEIGFLRYLRYGNREVVRGIYGAVRDSAWGTIAPQASELQVDQHADSFHVRFQMECRSEAIGFCWRGEITGNATTVRFSMTGTADRSFLTNRTGLCVLHPLPEGAAAECVVERVDGSEETGQFPIAVEPHQPFQNLRALRQKLAPDLSVRIAFDGDTFEMEDQRNWTDASFKTYSRPLALPMPYPLRAGETVQQAITVTFEGTGSGTDEESSVVSIQLSPQTVGRLPQLGLASASHGVALTPREIELLRALRPVHLRVDLHLAQPGYQSDLLQAAGEAAALEARLEVALFLTKNATAELTALQSALLNLRVPIARWLIYHETERATPERDLALARRLLRASPVFAPVVGGTNNSFADLNRNRLSAEQADLAVFAINPQVHAFDDRTLIENLNGQAHAVHSAKWLMHGKPVVVSPVTLRPRFNAEATGPEPPPLPGELPFAVDPRQMSLFGAGWTLGSVHALARSGASAVTFYEITGERGVMETERGSSLPELFASFPGGVFPLYHVLADLAGSRAEVLGTRSNRPLEAEALALRTAKGQVRLLVASHAGVTQTIRLSDLPAVVARMRVLDLCNVEQALQAPEEYRSAAWTQVEIMDGVLELELEPYAVATLDLEKVDE
jgi:hypothetical protein